jgi:beta-aspartyl-peptidase (threonine type)
MSFVLAIHGGAGTINPGADEAPYHAGLVLALRAGEAVLAQGGCALDAVVAAVRALEDVPLFNAGYGAVFTEAGGHELDASVMDGSTLAAGAVASVRHVKNPILAAQAVLTDGRFVLLGAKGADDFARDAGLEVVPNEYFSTAFRRNQLRAVQAQQPGRAVLDHSGASVQSSRFGTVGAVALDLAGHLAAATSTGGMTNKRAGRIGDTPLVGCGVYANDASCAVSATGTGEHFIRACVAYDVHARMVYGGMSLDAAAHAVLQGPLTCIGGEGGFLALGRDGSLAMPFNSTGMYRGVVREGQSPDTRIFQ